MAFGPFFEGEKVPYTFTVKDEDTGNVIDLTGYTVKVMLRKDGASTNKFTTASQEDGTIPAPATDGKVTYTMPAVWTVATDSGAWKVQLQLTPSGGEVRKTEAVRFRVELGLVPSA